MVEIVITLDINRGERSTMSSMTEAPQDSVLRRHWEASRQQQQPVSGQAHSTATHSAGQAPSGGFFSWLKSLFS